jgi:hypothetical protein
MDAVSAKKLPDLPPDWFCKDQDDLLVLITQLDEEEAGDDADSDPR